MKRGALSYHSLVLALAVHNVVGSGDSEVLLHDSRKNYEVETIQGVWEESELQTEHRRGVAPDLVQKPPSQAASQKHSSGPSPPLPRSQPPQGASNHATAVTHAATPHSRIPHPKPPTLSHHTVLAAHAC